MVFSFYPIRFSRSESWTSIGLDMDEDRVLVRHRKLIFLMKTSELVDTPCKFEKRKFETQNHIYPKYPVFLTKDSCMFTTLDSVNKSVFKTTNFKYPVSCDFPTRINLRMPQFDAVARQNPEMSRLLDSFSFNVSHDQCYHK